MFDKDFGGFIWTDHALQRLKERGIKQGDAWATLRHPDESRFASSQGAWVYYKTYGDQKIEVVAKRNERKQWVVLSVWSRSVYSNKPTSSQVTPLWKLIFDKLFKKSTKN